MPRKLVPHGLGCMAPAIEPCGDMVYVQLCDYSALEASHKELVEALRNVLNRLPDLAIIEALKADAGLGHRPMPMNPTPTDADVTKWIGALANAEKLTK